MATAYREIDLPKFVEECRSQAAAAAGLGCSQGNISQALADIEAGTKRVTVRIYKNGRIEADMIKPFGRNKSAA